MIKMTKSIILPLLLLFLLNGCSSSHPVNENGIMSDSNEIIADNNTEEITPEEMDNPEEITPEAVTPNPTSPNNTGSLVEFGKLDNIFAIANETGDQLITFTFIEDTSEMEGLNAAIGNDGQYYAIEFLKKQDISEQDNGRAIASNFDNMEGYVYTLPKEKAVPNQTYYLSSIERTPESNLLTSATTEPLALSTEEKTAISDAKDRVVQEGWILADYGNGMQLQMAVFEPEGNNYLMSILMKTKEGNLKFMDYPVEVEFEPYTVWRVDDGGVIEPSYFSILFASLTDEGFVFTLSWAGFEGEIAFMLLEQTDSLQEQPESAYRYWSPV